VDPALPREILPPEVMLALGRLYLLGALGGGAEVRRDERVRAFPARVAGPIVPAYPEAARRIVRWSRVLLDLLIDPEARVTVGFRIHRPGQRRTAS
jgi:hypothetical protein